MCEKYFKLAADTARNATCTHAKCGSIIVSSDGVVIGSGFNAPPLNDEDQRKCDFVCDETIKSKYDNTCCVHAEWNAIIDALRNYPDEIFGSTLYFMRIDNNGNFTNAGDPFCTVCSRLALQSGISKFALWNDDPQFFSTKEYNEISYNFYNDNPDAK